MKHDARSYLLMFILVTAGWLLNGEIGPSGSDLVAGAEARLGRPATPVSYAGVARRTTVRVATPGVGAGAPGVGVTPGVNAGGPVNRVGVR